MKTHGEAKPESPPSARQICPGFLPRGVSVWVPKRIIPRLGALSVVGMRTKQGQFPPGRPSRAIGNPARYAGHSRGVWRLLFPAGGLFCAM
jgi:hypothetical protein